MSFIKDILTFKTKKKYNNKIVLVRKDGSLRLFPKISGVEFIINGKNNTVEFEEPVPEFTNCKVIINGDNSNFIIKKSNYGLWNTCFKLYTNSTIKIGEDFSCAGALFECSSGRNIVIGNDCMFSDHIYLRTDDGHTIVDCETGKPLNEPKDINIGNHVWACYSATFLKGAKVLNDCVIAAYAIINKELNVSSSIITGISGRGRGNISWNRDEYIVYNYKFNQKRMKNDFNNFTDI